MQPFAGTGPGAYSPAFGCLPAKEINMTRSGIRIAATILTLGASTAGAQNPVDSALVAYIASIRAIDNHAHPMRPVQAGAPADSEFDALPLDGISPFPLPWRVRRCVDASARLARRGSAVARHTFIVC